MFSSFFNDPQSKSLPDLPSPKNVDEYEQLSQKMFQDVLFLEKDSADWQLLVEKEGVSVWELPSRQKGAAVCVKSRGIMPRSAKVSLLLFNAFLILFSFYFHSYFIFKNGLVCLE
jgi:hypothetical protein